MKNKAILTIILLTVLIGLIGSLSAQITLPVDGRKIPIQLSKSFSCLAYSPGADTLWRAITVPAGTVEVLLTPATGGIGLRADNSTANNNYATIPVGVPTRIPVITQRTIYIRRAVAGTASVAHLIFYKM
ncbi:MAG: hypothetical protein Q8M98_07315 [Candidatus Cloacimonadaceae bacterium]|nr:hypothetical protein [Candidatus Cloacimonadaceae bacterium]